MTNISAANPTQRPSETQSSLSVPTADAGAANVSVRHLADVQRVDASTVPARLPSNASAALTSPSTGNALGVLRSALRTSTAPGAGGEVSQAAAKRVSWASDEDFEVNEIPARVKAGVAKSQGGSPGGASERKRPAVSLRRRGPTSGTRPAVQALPSVNIRRRSASPGARPSAQPRPSVNLRRR